MRSVDQGQVVRRYALTTSQIGDALVLDQIQEVAPDGQVLPATTFGHLSQAGYTRACNAGQDEGGWKPWLNSIANGYGGGTSFNYTAPLGMPWFQNGQTLAPHTGEQCWYRYRVREVKTTDGLDNVTRTVYEYHTLWMAHPRPATGN